MDSSDEGDTDRAFYLPRLDRRFYQGDAQVHWTLTIRDRATGWLAEALHARFRELLLHALARGRLVCPVYCLMPDHLHMIWMGLDESCDQMKSIAFFDTYFEPMLSPFKLQPQPHDHVLVAEEKTQDAFQNAAHYILDNPVRAKLVPVRAQWPYLGCIVPGYPKLHPLEAGYWQKFWRIHGRLRLPSTRR